MGEVIKLWAKKLIKKWPIHLFYITLCFFEDHLRNWLRDILQGFLESQSRVITDIMRFLLENSTWIPWALVPTIIIILLIWTYVEAKKEEKRKPIAVSRVPRRKRRLKDLWIP